MITVNNLSMGFTERQLFKDVTFSIFPKEKIGLTGPNGSGKTTLFSLILGQQQPVSGSVVVQKNINIGYLPQEVQFLSDKTVIEELTEGDERVHKLKDEKRKLEDSGKAATDRYGDVLHDLEQLGIYEIEHKAEKILMGLGFKAEDFDRPIKNLSGGWQMRTLLAKLLCYSYDLLLLDEPTNYLDLQATLWLKTYLAAYQGAFVLISHDRIFVNDVTNYTILLDRSQMVKVKGNYAAFEEQRASDQKTLEKRKKVVDKKRQQLERFTQRFHAQPNKAAAVRNKRKMIDKLENIELGNSQESIKDFEFDEIPSSGYVIAQCEGLEKSYDEKQVYSGIDFELIRGQKVCFVGPNGAGKSTLLKMLAEVVEPDRGTIKLGHNVKRGYFSQSRLDVLNMARNAFEEVASSAPQGVQAVKVRSLLGLFNFHGDDVFKNVKILSGGEKSRLILAKLLINPPNFMLLDEPTTHLDLDGVKALTSAFQKYDGTVCFISHNLYFIKELANCIVEIDDGKIKTYPGGLQYYLEKKGSDISGSLKFSSKKKSKGGDSAPSEQQSSNTKKNKKKSKGSSPVSEMHQKHQSAVNRKKDIKKEIKKLEKEFKDLEMESYVKARHLEKDFDQQDSQTLKEYGIRLKEIQSRLRKIESTIKNLKIENREIER